MAVTGRPPDISAATLSEIVVRHFPFENIDHTSIRQLVSYQDRNYRFIGTIEGESSSEEFVFKVNNVHVSLELVEGQNAVMNHLKESGIACSVPLASRQSQYYTVISSNEFRFQLVADFPQSAFCVRVFPYLRGDMLNSVEITEQVLRSLGMFVGRMDNALTDFTHPAIEAGVNHCWDLRNFPDVKRYLYVIDDLSKIAMATQVFDYFSEYIEPMIPLLRHRIIHADCNEQNILLHRTHDGGPYDVCGILDFGDCVHSCLVFNLAILLTYVMLLLVNKDPLRAAVPVILAYQEVQPLTKSELKLLYYCVLVRLCLSVLTGAHSYRQEPTNAYLLSTQETGWKLIQILLSTSKEEVDRVWCQQEHHVTTHA